MAEKLIIMLVNSDPTNPSELGAPFSQAIVAAAMAYEVEIIISGRAGELACKGVSEKLVVPGETQHTVYELIQEAHQAGVTIKVCTPTPELTGDDLISEIDEIVGGAYLISEAMDSDTVTFTY